jgi:peptidoglycan/xylan/chitin deacetylase (PgdA/CDA1 family)
LAACTTSWDDGHPLDQRLAELLSKYGLSGTFYIPFANSREVMNPEEIRQLGDKFEIGAHTVNHTVLTEVPPETAETEIVESKKRLEDLLGRPCEAFCFPKGQFRQRHVNMVRRAGFRCARTVELLSTRFPKRQEGLDLIPTTIQATPHPWTAYARNCSKRLAIRNMANFALHARSRDWSGIASSMLRVVAERGGVFHLWGHSWEIEQQQQWAQLESVLREMQELRTTVPCVPNSQLSSLENC